MMASMLKATTTSPYSAIVTTILVLRALVSSLLFSNDFQYAAGSVYVADSNSSSLTQSLRGASPVVSTIPTEEAPLAWLMSFPNSGTSYTLAMMETITGKPMATNYAKETDSRDNNVVPRTPVIPGQMQGPYWLSEATPRDPGEHILTKTHCGSRCSGCLPNRFEESLTNFVGECASDAIRGTPPEPYPVDRVQKAIHLIRDPFDNIVSRFHLRLHKGRTETTASGRDNFRNYCFQEENTNENDLATLKRFLTAEQLAQLDPVPCRAEFFKYVLWHNHAFETTKGLDLETLVVHYDYYEKDFAGTTDQIVNFLGMKKTLEPEPFVKGKIYSEYFTQEERDAVKNVMRDIASSETWSRIERYFQEANDAKQNTSSTTTTTTTEAS